MSTQQNVVNVADIRDPESGLTFREMNLKMVHNIPIGTLVEITYKDGDSENDEEGLRLFVGLHERDCDGTPLYSLTGLTPSNQKLTASVFGEKSIIYRGHFTHGHSEENLKVIRLPRKN